MAEATQLRYLTDDQHFHFCIKFVIDRQVAKNVRCKSMDTQDLFCKPVSTVVTEINSMSSP